MIALKFRIWLCGLLVLSGLCVSLAAAAMPLAIDGSVTTNTCPGGGIVRDGGRACEYGGTGTCIANKCASGAACVTGADCPLPTFDSITLVNGAIIYVTTYDNTVGNKPYKGNLTLKSATSITIDKTSRITVKGGGYQADVCNDGPGPAAFPLAGGRGGCSVKDSGGGGAHFGKGGKGTKDCFIYPGGASDVTCTFPNEWEEACGSKGNGACNAQVATEAGGLICYDKAGVPAGSNPALGAGDALPDVSGQPFFHNILDVEFGAAGGDKGCRDGYDNLNCSGNGGGRIVLFAANAGKTGAINIDGRVDADGNRGCASGNDSAGGGAGGTILIIGDTVNVGATARITARGGRGGDSQPKGLACNVDADCRSTYNGSAANGQFCRTLTEPASGNTYKRCDPANCTPQRAAPSTPCDPGYSAVTLGGDFGKVCVPSGRNPTTFPTCTTTCASPTDECLALGGGVGTRCVPKNQPICDYLDFGDNEEECRNRQNQGTCDDCAGGGGGGIINVQSRTNLINPQAIFDVRGGNGGICPICAGEAGAGAGELQIDAAYVGEICDGKDNDFNGVVDDGLPNLNCPDGTTPPSCVAGVPQSCPTVPACAGPVTDTRPRFAVVVDTSGSMVLDAAGVPHFGDGSEAYPGVGGNQTRLFAAKGALSDVLAAFPDSDYALGRYYQDSGLARSCQTANWFECAKNCCSYDDPTDNVAPPYPYYYPDGQCIPSQLYQANTSLSSLSSNINVGWPLISGNIDKSDCINYAGTCGPPNRGAQYLVDFGQPLPNYLMWLDNKETNFKSATDCAGGDCELRATGPTPLASSLQATLDFLKPRIACDNAVPCRKYNVILLTDGAESCQGDPAAAAAQLNAGVVKMVGGSPTTVSVKTYVIGFSVLPTEQAQLNSIAASGGTNTAFFANTRDELANALATIISGSFVFEKCNGADDDCDGLIDEDFPDKGAACNDGKLGICRGTGHKVCKADGSGTTCQIDVPGQTGTQEICNNLDDNCNGFVDEGLSCSGCVPQQEVCDGADNNCDGQIDEPQNLVDINKPCGSNIGVCKPGLTVCTNGVLDCTGQTKGSTEVCDGLDNDCNNVVDGMTQTCYDGPAPTLGVGPCHGGTQVCTAVLGSGTPKWGACQGEVLPKTEVCDGIDNDCNGTIDDGVAAGSGKVTGDQCCPAGVPCGVPNSQCSYGTYQCAGKVVVCAGFTGPSNELCDGVDNDCNGQVDDIPGLGGSCLAQGACAGKLVCDSTLKQLVCQPIGTTAVEICNGLDDNCNGQIDEEPDVSTNDTRVGVACDAPPAGHDQPPCKAGTTACVNGNIVCNGAVGPVKEVCDGKDNDCDGMADQMGACPGANACKQGVCVEPCRQGEFPCGGGFQCQDGYCIPTSCDKVTCPTGKVCMAGACVDAPDGGGSAGSGSAGDSGAGGSGASSASGGASGSGTSAGSSSGGTSSGGTSSGGTSSGGTNSAGTSNAGTSGTSDAGSAGTAGSVITPPTPQQNPNAVYGLATGGGGCACRVAAAPTRKPLLGLLGLALLGALAARRRERTAGRAA